MTFSMLTKKKLQNFKAQAQRARIDIEVEPRINAI